MTTVLASILQPQAFPAPPVRVLLNLQLHSNMYVLERVQHRVPEEALKVSVKQAQGLGKPHVGTSGCQGSAP